MFKNKTLQDIIEELKEELIRYPEIQDYNIIEFKIDKMGELIIDLNICTKNENKYHSIIISKGEREFYV